jgi:hypothetical protein
MAFALRYSDERWHAAARFWGRTFGINVAVRAARRARLDKSGAVSHTLPIRLMRVVIGLSWQRRMWRRNTTQHDFRRED